MKRQLSNKSQHTTLEVRIMFESSRLAQRWLQQAYEQVMPLARGSVPQRMAGEMLSLPLVKGTKQQRGGTEQ
jgi:hypothetical protein